MLKEAVFTQIQKTNSVSSVAALVTALCLAVHATKIPIVITEDQLLSLYRAAVNAPEKSPLEEISLRFLSALVQHTPKYYASIMGAFGAETQNLSISHIGVCLLLCYHSTNRRNMLFLEQKNDHDFCCRCILVDLFALYRY